MRVKMGVSAVVVTASIWAATSAAAATITPDWECVPTTPGQTVLSGGTGASPSCGSGTTAVLAPTYVSSGVGGKPTVEFSAVNLQVVSGSGSTSAAVNGEGNLVIGYAENPGSHARTGSNDLIVGSNNGWSSYGELVGGSGDQAGGAFASVLGSGNMASGAESSVIGGENGLASSTAASVSGGNRNTASGSNGAWVAGGFENVSKGSSTSVSGGTANTATGANSSIGGGEHNLGSGSVSFIGGGCDNLAGTGTPSSGTCSTSGVNAILGGWKNLANGPMAAVAGGQDNQAQDEYAFVGGGCANVSGGSSGLFCSSSDGADPGVGSEAILGGEGNFAGPFGSVTGVAAAIVGGDINSAGGVASTVLGGSDNTVTGACQAIPASPGTC